MGAPAFLGRGLLIPLRREGTDFRNGGGMDLLTSAVRLVLGTRCAGDRGEAGEIPWRQEFGSRLHLLRHRNLDAVTRELTRFYSEDALVLWEPRVQVSEVVVVDDVASNRRSATIGFAPISANRPDNRVIVARAEAEVIV